MTKLKLFKQRDRRALLTNRRAKCRKITYYRMRLSMLIRCSRNAELDIPKRQQCKTSEFSSCNLAIWMNGLAIKILQHWPVRWDFPGISCFLDYFWNPVQLPWVTHTLYLADNYCQLLLYTRHTNSSILSSILRWHYFLSLSQLQKTTLKWSILVHQACKSIFVNTFMIVFEL